MKDFLKGIIYVGLFTIPLVPLIVTDSMFFPFITGKNFTFRILVEIVFGAWVVLALLDRMYRPRFSWLLVSASAFLIVMFFANAFGEYPLKSFWSNFERMDGYVTIMHFYLLFVVLGSTFRDKEIWKYFMYMSLAAATFIAFDGLQQYINKVGSWRIDSTLGNAAYMAIYMFFHAFFAVWLFVHAKGWWTRALWGGLFLLFSYLLLLTATRGTFIALAGGLVLMAAYLVIFNTTYPVVRKYALIAFVLMILAVGSIFTFKDSAFISENPAFTRIASINLEKDLAGRMDIWGMAIEGVKQRPVLGWGQGNFNYVFNAEYDPDIYYGESWYDRVHNIGLDWLIAGGILGFVTYISIFLALAYYLFYKPLFTREEDQPFTVIERAVLIGLVAGYFTHNLVVFDNIVSYIFFAIVLGLIHARVSESIPDVEAFTIDSRIVTNIIAPVMLLFMGTVIYFVNIPPMQASGDIIDALTAGTLDKRLAEIESAINRDSFAYQEIIEQFAQQAMQIAANPNIPSAEKQMFVNRAETELLKLAAEKPGDARVHVFISGYYRSIGNIPESKKHIDIARTLSPTKQAIILEQGIIAYQMGDFEAMHDYFKEAFELQTDYKLARTFYASSLMYVDRADEVRALVVDEDHFFYFAVNDFALQSANRFNQIDLLKEMFAIRIAENPNNAQNRTSLAAALYKAGDTEGAVQVLQEGIDAIPSFETLGACYIANIEAGNEPNQGCQ